MLSADKNDPAHSIRWLMLFGASIAILTLTLSGWLTLNASDQAWQRAEKSGANLTLALERDIKRNISGYDLSLLGAIKAFALPDIATASPELRQAALFDQAASAEYLGSILILNADGDIVADSTSLEPRKMNFADREYFKVQRASDVGLFISLPIVSRLRTGAPAIALSRRISSVDGSFKGITVGTMNVNYFEKLFSNLDLGIGGQVFLVNIDGHIISQYPQPALQTDTPSIAGSENLQAMLREPSGHFIQNGAQDGVRRLYTFSRIGDLPVVLALGVSAEAINATWAHKAIIDGSIQLALCVGTIALCFLFRREMAQRVGVEIALRSAMDRLTTIATLDVLTGVGNRRFFETMFDTEWRRAQRARTNMAVLMLDADWFKLYNDRYGHLGGDLVLKAIALAIQQSIRRPADFVTRYGGEEFVVILPETDAAGATIIGEKIRNAVFSMMMPHEGSPLGYVSVSIGMAIADAYTTRSKEAILKSADQALYAAKESGRNCVVMSNDGASPVTIQIPPLTQAKFS